MTTSDLVKKACEEESVSLAELARRLGQSRQNLYKKLQRDTLTLEELQAIAKALGATFEQSFILPNGERIKASQEE